MITNENYFSPEVASEYLSASQFNAFSRCEAGALAEITGEYTRKETAALLQGSYIDAHIEGTLNLFLAKHPEMVSSRGPTAGQLKAEYRMLDNVIERFERDPLFVEYLTGEKQKILTGTIGGVKFRGKIDILHPDRIVDFKAMRDFSPVWSDEDHAKVPFVEYWGYIAQGAIYRELVRQVTGKTLPFFIAGVTKEEEPDIAIISIPDEALSEKLREIEYYAPLYLQIKQGTETPTRCEKCPYCRSTKVLTGPVSYLEV